MFFSMTSGVVSINSDYKSFEECSRCPRDISRRRIFSKLLDNDKKKDRRGYQTINGFMPKLDLNDPTVVPGTTESFLNDPESFLNDSTIVPTAVRLLHRRRWWRISFWKNYMGCYKVVDDNPYNCHQYTILKLLQER